MVTAVADFANRPPLGDGAKGGVLEVGREEGGGGRIKASGRAGVEFGAIELDESPGEPLDAVRESVEFFRSKGITE